MSAVGVEQGASRIEGLQGAGEHRPLVGGDP
mgnify:FL=1